MSPKEDYQRTTGELHQVDFRQEIPSIQPNPILPALAIVSIPGLIVFICWVAIKLIK